MKAMKKAAGSMQGILTALKSALQHAADHRKTCCAALAEVCA